MHAGLDWTNFQPTMTPELAAQLRDLGVLRLLCQTQFPTTFQPCAAACVSAGIGLDAVRFLYNPGSDLLERHIARRLQHDPKIPITDAELKVAADALRKTVGLGGDYVAQAQQALDQIAAAAPARSRYLDLDFEDDTGDTTGIGQALLDAIALCENVGQRVRVYTGAWFWGPYAGAASSYTGPFRMAIYDGLAALRGYDAVQYSASVSVLGIDVNPNVCADTNL